MSSLLKLTGIIAIFGVGLVLGAIWYRSQAFPFPQLALLQYQLFYSDTSTSDADTERAPGSWDALIPMQYLPYFVEKVDADGKVTRVRGRGHELFQVPTDEIALVLVDTWAESNEPESASPIRQRQIDFLQAARDHNITIIHAPSQPTVNNYAQYHELKSEVDTFMNDYDDEAENPPPFLSWPESSNDVYVKSTKLRTMAHAHKPFTKKAMTVDISPSMKPVDGEYVVNSHNEFRYVLWKEKIKMVLYVGGATNECLQHRDAGINLLTGSDRDRVPIAIVVLDDCTVTVGSPGVSSEDAHRVFMDYFMTKITFVSTSTDIEFVDPNSSDPDTAPEPVTDDGV